MLHRLLPYLALILSVLALGCADDEGQPAPAQAQDVSDAAQADEGTPAGQDVVIADPCLGLKQDTNAAPYDDQCQGITECTDMPAQSSGCYCAICGVKGNTSVCIQAQCSVPGS